MPGRHLLHTSDQAWIVEAGAGESWHGFVQWTLEQGLPGLLFFLAFVAWFVTRPIHKDDPARMSKTLLWFITAITFSTAFIGIGMMSSIPGTAMMLLGLGYCVTPALATAGLRRRDFMRGHQSMFAARSSAPAYQRGLART